MYGTAIRALTGEIVGKNRMALLGAAVLTPAAWLIALAYMRHVPGMDSNFGTPFGLMLLVILAMQLGTVLCVRGSHRRRQNVGISQAYSATAYTHVVAGPGSDRRRVALHIRFCAVRFLSSIEFDVTQRLVLAAAITSVMCWIQAISWELLPLRYLRLVVLLVAVLTIIVSVISTLAKVPDLLFGRTGGEIGLVVTTTAGYALAYLAVIRARRGQSQDLGAALKRLFSAPRLSGRHARLPALSDAVMAQDWFEWRVYGRILPLFMIIIGAGPLASVVFERMRNAPSIAMSTMLLVVFYAIVSPMMGVAYISKDLSRRVDLGAFAATRPLSDLELAFAKLRLSLKSYALSVALVFAVIGVVILCSSNNSALLTLWSRLTVQLGTIRSGLGVLLLLGAVTVASWTATALFMSLQLFQAAVDRKKYGWQISVGSLALFLLLLAAVRRAFAARESVLLWLQSVHLQVMIPPVALAVMALCLVPLFRRVAPLKGLKVLALGFVGATALGLAYLSQLNVLLGYRWAMSSVLLSLVLLALMPFLVVPILVGMSRHR